MVCLLTPLKVQSDRELNETTKSPGQETAMSDDNNDDPLKLRRLAGGSIIDYPPLFSPDGELLLVIFKNLVHVYSTNTGEWVRDLEGAADQIVAVRYELNNPKIVVALTETGDLIRWKWKSGSIKRKEKLPLRNVTFHTFHFVDLLPDSTSVFVTFSSLQNRNVSYAVFDTTSGKRLNISGKMDLKSSRFVIDVENQYFHYAAAVQGHLLHVLNYTNGESRIWKNGNAIPFTTVRVHPTEEMIATGDERGRIFLWRHIFSNNYPYTNIYHWHHTAVTSISFTQSGTGFYSGGQESVLVQWNIDRPDLKNFLPRLHAIILHITVGEENRKIAISTADNGVQILGAQNHVKCMLQNFSYIYNDKTGLSKFPVGLKINPRTNSLALNGRAGHLQFYSTYTKRLLYNMDIVMQNQLSVEADKILYNIRVSSAAFNIDWMATAEEWDDQEYSPEHRLKFWQFNKEKQNYALNTNIEGPHELGIKAIEFSNPIEVENLLCATAGMDNFIKLWTLENADDIYKTRKVWFCTGRTNYKNFTLDCINFSQDGSLLSAGFGNTLCIYKAETLKLKAELSAPGAFSGIVQKVQMTMPKESLNGSQRNQGPIKNELIEKRKKTLELFKGLLDGNDQTLMQMISKKEPSIAKRKSIVPLTSFNTKQQEFLFKKIRSLIDLSLFQKIDLFQKLGIYCTVPKESQHQLVTYLTKNILEKNYIECNLDSNIKNINIRHRFKAKYRLNRYIERKEQFRSNVKSEQKLVPVRKLFNLNESLGSSKQGDGIDRSNSSKCNGFNGSDEEIKSSSSEAENILPPLQSVASVRHVAFGTGEHAHLVIVCTEYRVLIWNILTLRLQSVLRLSVDKIVVDPLTSLCAAFTTNAELYVFLPNPPISLYHRINVPKINGAVWVPSRYPKSQSLNIDWQSISTLYFLTEQQELMYLAADNDVSDLGSATSYISEPQDVVRHSTFGAFAANQANSKVTYSSQHSTAIGVLGKETIKSLIETSTHTMAPTRLLCSDFIKAFLMTEGDKKVADNNEVVDDEHDSDDGSIDGDVRMKLRQVRINHNSADVTNTVIDTTKQLKQREKLRKVLKENIDITF